MGLLGEAAGTAPCWCPASAAWTARSKPAAGTWRSSGSATRRPSRRRTSTGSLDEQFAMFEPTVRRAATRGSTSAPMSDVLRRPLGGRGPDRAGGLGRRRFSTRRQPAQPRRRRVGTTGHVTALVRGVHRQPGWASTSSPCASTTPAGQALANTHAALQAGITTYDAQRRWAWAAALREERDGQPRRRGPGWMLTGLGIEHGVDLGQVARPASGWPGSWAAPSPRPS